MTRERRASAGWVKGPCPGCKKGDTHPKDDICTDCRILLDDARRIVAAHERQDVEAWFNYQNCAHWNPGFYLGCEIDSAARDRLHHALHDLIMTAATATFEADYHSFQPHHLKKAPMPLIERAKGLPDHRDGARGLVLLRYEVAQKINELDAAIIQALVSVALQEFQEGSNLLLQLARGTITPDKLNDVVAQRVESLRKEHEASQEPAPSKRRKIAKDR